MMELVSAMRKKGAKGLGVAEVEALLQSLDLNGDTRLEVGRAGWAGRARAKQLLWPARQKAHVSLHGLGLGLVSDIIVPLQSDACSQFDEFVASTMHPAVLQRSEVLLAAFKVRKLG